MNPICFYHKADLDGVCSGAIVKHFVPDCELYGIDYGQEFPWGVAEPWPEENLTQEEFEAKGFRHDLVKRTVYMVDFSLPPEDMKRLAGCSDLCWIDHHKTAIEALGNALPGMRDARYAACELAWAWFSNPEGSSVTSLPEAVRLLGAYDSWRQDDPEWDERILPFQYAIRAEDGAYDPASELWPFLFGVNGYSLSMEAYDERPWKDHAIVRGAAILRYQAEVNRRACEAGAHEFVWTMPDPELQLRTETDKDGNTVLIQPMGMKLKLDAGKCERVPNAVMPSYRVLACNTIVFNSNFFDGFYDPEKHDVMCAYCRITQKVSLPGSTREHAVCTGAVPPMSFTVTEYPRDGTRLVWKVSLYSTKPEIDCGAVAKTFGGGGHKGAAGFVCDKLPWEKK